jgi:hypothetical protein
MPKHRPIGQGRGLRRVDLENPLDDLLGCGIIFGVIW